jgi:hypothetical protein
MLRFDVPFCASVLRLTRSPLLVFCNQYSADDPLFYLHHSNIERIWTIWQDYHDHDRIPRNNLGTDDFTGGSSDQEFDLGIDDPLPFFGSNYPDWFQIPGTSSFPTARDLHHSTNRIQPDAIVRTRYVDDSLAYSLDRITRNFDRYFFSNDPLSVDIGSGPVETVDCSEPTPSPTPRPRRAPAAPRPAPTHSLAPPADDQCTLGQVNDGCWFDGHCCSNVCWWYRCIPQGNQMNTQSRGTTGRSSVSTGSRVTPRSRTTPGSRQLEGNIFKNSDPPPPFVGEYLSARWEEISQQSLSLGESILELRNDSCAKRGDPVLFSAAWIQMSVSTASEPCMKKPRSLCRSRTCHSLCYLFRECKMNQGRFSVIGMSLRYLRSCC